MRLTPWEEERILIFSAAELARRHRAAGLPLNAPEAIAVICDAMLEAARAGADYAAVETAGRAAVGPGDVMPGVRELVDVVRLEVLVGDGTRVVVLVDPLGSHDVAAGSGGPTGPGAIRPSTEEMRPAPASASPPPAASAQRPSIELTVRSASRRVIHVSSHYPFHRVNPRLQFDRQAARGYRLDLPAGAAVRWGPGETRTVRLVPFGGAGGDGS